MHRVGLKRPDWPKPAGVSFSGLLGGTLTVRAGHDFNDGSSARMNSVDLETDPNKT
jgi:hypothetical protein